MGSRSAVPYHRQHRRWRRHLLRFLQQRLELRLPSSVNPYPPGPPPPPITARIPPQFQRAVTNQSSVWTSGSAAAAAPASPSTNSAQLKRILAGLQAEGDDPRQLSSFMQLCEMLSISIGTEDSLAAFPVDAFVPLLVGLLGCEEAAGGACPDVMLLAATPSPTSSMSSHRLLLLIFVSLVDMLLESSIVYCC